MEKVSNLTTWCTNNDLVLNNKETILDFRTTKMTTHSSVHLNTGAVDRVLCIRFLQRTSLGLTTPHR